MGTASWAGAAIAARAAEDRTSNDEERFFHVSASIG